ncbi:MAG: hypothetical protein ACERKO_06025, partial [Acetanaerobacterium sp.]
MKKAIIITAIVTVASLMCIIGFATIAVMKGVPIAAQEINRFIGYDWFIGGLDIGDIISEAIADVEFDGDFIADD